MTINNFKTGIEGQDIIKRWEKFEPRPYICPTGHPTIGWGTIRYPNSKKVTLKDTTITKCQAQEYLDHDLGQFEKAVNMAVKVKLNQEMFDAIICLVYNIGETSFNASTLLKRLNQKDFSDATLQFLRWNKGRVKGKLVVLRGLVNRRKEESELFQKGLDKFLNV